jgi:transposase
VNKIIRIGLDTSKHLFQVHGVDGEERVVLRRQLRRGEVERFFAGLEPALIGLEACAASHYWARRLRALGHEARLVPPQYVKAYVKRGKNDRIDAEAICEALGRPSMRFVPIKSEAQQAGAMLLKVRDLLIKQRTALVNAIRAHAAEFGVIGAKGVGRVKDVIEKAGQTLPRPAFELLLVLAGALEAMEARLKQVDAQLLAWHRGHEMSRRLAGVPGIGPIGAMTLVLRVPDPAAFRSARHFAAWTGLTPREHSTAGRRGPGRISREGDEPLRRLLVVGAISIIKLVRRGRSSPWLTALMQRRPPKLVAVALANKLARIAWAMMISGEAYRGAKMA